MTYDYYERWFRAKRRPVAPLTLTQARDAAAARTLFTAVCRKGVAPVAFLEFNSDYVGVGFLDDLMREYLTYQFSEVEPGRLFLNMAVFREYRAETDQIVNGSTYHFKPSGTVTILYDNIAAGKQSSVEKVAGVADNWEDYPAFGQYGRLLHIERLGK